MVMVAPEDLLRVRAAVADRFGHWFSDDRLEELSAVLKEQMARHQMTDCAEYVASLFDSRTASAEWRALIERVTVGETYFFRNSNQFRALAQSVVPELLRARPQRSRLRLLSAGCASGEEAYTMAMILSEESAAASLPVEVVGVDVNPAALARARAGRYSHWSLRETPEAVRRRCFVQEGKEFLLDKRFKEMARFQEANLIDDNSAIWQSGSFDVVFCCNVVIYMNGPTIRALVARIARVLAPDGFLFMGHSENLRGMTSDFQLCHSQDTFYYQRRGSQAPALAPQDEAPVELAPAALPGEEWYSVIQRSADRIANLAKGAGPAPLPAPPQWDRAPVLKLLEEERFEEAYRVLESLPPPLARNPEARLFRAVLLTNRRDLVGAEKACRELLSGDDLNAGAHYLMALCCEQAGRTGDAAEHDLMAIHLDPAFAMPHFHLGLMARRTGDTRTAIPALKKALELFGREESSRLVLFGGGFKRDTLIRLCRTQLQAAGGTE
jgi:chemotaxis protein methyltransferase CheR